MLLGFDTDIVVGGAVPFKRWATPVATVWAFGNDGQEQWSTPLSKCGTPPSMVHGVARQEPGGPIVAVGRGWEAGMGSAPAWARLGPDGAVQASAVFTKDGVGRLLAVDVEPGSGTPFAAGWLESKLDERVAWVVAISTKGVLLWSRKLMKDSPKSAAHAVMTPSKRYIAVAGSALFDHGKGGTYPGAGWRSSTLLATRSPSTGASTSLGRPLSTWR